jgi:hypothetical protein
MAGNITSLVSTLLIRFDRFEDRLRKVGDSQRKYERVNVLSVFLMF